MKLSAVVSFAFLFILCGSEIFAEPRSGHDDGIRLIDVGVIGLTSHDLISWDREKKELRNPHGRLDLDTIFDWVDSRSGQNTWETGGDPKNSENAVVYSVVQQLIGFYKANLEFLKSQGAATENAKQEARVKTISHYLKLVRVSYERLFGLKFPEHAIENGLVTHEEHAAMRAVHNILPGKMKVHFGPMIREIELTDYKYSQMILSSLDLDQPIQGFKGRYDEEYLHFTIPFGPRKGENQNLYEIDKAFVTEFTKLPFDQMIQEIANCGTLKGVSFEAAIESLYSKGLGSADNKWMKEALNDL